MSDGCVKRSTFNIEAARRVVASWLQEARATPVTALPTLEDALDEIERLRARVAELEKRVVEMRETHNDEMRRMFDV